jgi:hypothetical protein
MEDGEGTVWFSCKVSQDEEIQEGRTLQQHRKHEQAQERNDVTAGSGAIWTQGKRTKTPEGTPK